MIGLGLVLGYDMILRLEDYDICVRIKIYIHVRIKI